MRIETYIYSKDKYGRYTIRGKSIGITTSVTSFYNSDKQKWAIGSTIDVRDNSGDKFLTSLITKKPHFIIILLQKNVKNSSFKAYIHIYT